MRILKNEELINYLQQGRLFPHLATLYAWTIFGYNIFRTSDVNSKKSSAAEKAEMHALISATKPLSTWSAQTAIQDCREACGGHGYLKGLIKKYILYI